MASPAREPKAPIPLSEALATQVLPHLSPDNTLPTTSQTESARTLGHSIGAAGIEYLSVRLRRKIQGPYIEMDICWDKLDLLNPTQDKLAQVISRAHTEVAFAFEERADLTLNHASVNTRTPREMREHLENFVATTGDRVLLSGPIQTIPWLEPHITPD